MKKIIVASKNPVKIQATLTGFQHLFPELSWDIDGISVPSGVRDQPLSGQETLEGAQNRVEAAAQKIKNADYWVGIEGGIRIVEEEMMAAAWVIVKSAEGKCGKAQTGGFFLPPEIVRLIQSGKELGEADDIVFGQNQGAVGILTHDVLNRTSYYAQAVILALIPFKNPALY